MLYQQPASPKSDLPLCRKGKAAKSPGVALMLCRALPRARPCALRNDMRTSRKAVQTKVTSSGPTQVNGSRWPRTRQNRAHARPKVEPILRAGNAQTQCLPSVSGAAPYLFEKRTTPTNERRRSSIARITICRIACLKRVSEKRQADRAVLCPARPGRQALLAVAACRSAEA